MIGAYIRKYRTQSQMTQAELGKRLGTSGAVISSWEVDRTEPNLGQCIAMTDIFGITLDELCTGISQELAKEKVDPLSGLVKYMNLPPEKRALVDDYIEFVSGR